MLRLSLDPATGKARCRFRSHATAARGRLPPAEAIEVIERAARALVRSVVEDVALEAWEGIAIDGPHASGANSGGPRSRVASSPRR
ncbi:MAG: hypothetical protein M3003_04745, partial [Candidatus Dormibacteraeota bacterium]|nr:hypothetical protein [Candidatus Dormibacteraeota bacterium]